MRRTPWYQFFLSLILIVFTLNVTVAYGSCCLDTTQEQSEVAMPCHDTERVMSVDDEKCCAACFNLQPSNQLGFTSPNLDVTYSAPPSFYHIHTVDPPYKPPIAHLS